jgi:hypothetical protein
MKRIVLFIVFPALLLIPNGCKAFMNFASSSFLSNFSLEELVKKNRSPSGMICAKGGMGGGGGGGSSVGRKQSSSNKSSSFSCQISDDSFDEAAFITSLKADVEQEINRSGATITNRGSSDPSGFYFEYRESDVHGRISIEGKKSGAKYYSLEARLNERSGAESK